MPAKSRNLAGLTDPAAPHRPNVDTNRFRIKRFSTFVKMLESIESKGAVRVLDVGGTRAYWEGLQDHWGHIPLEITLLNLDALPEQDGPFRIVAGNACALEYGDDAFDIVHSNSVIEHVGGWQAMMAMAGEIRRVAPRYFVQTPNFWFPIEPHFRSVYFQLLPQGVRARMLMKGKRGHRPRAQSFEEAMVSIESVNLLTAPQMRALFPDATIVKERVFGLIKSLIAIR